MLLSMFSNEDLRTDDEQQGRATKATEGAVERGAVARSPPRRPPAHALHTHARLSSVAPPLSLTRSRSFFLCSRRSPSLDQFVNGIIGNAIPPEYISAVGKGFEESMVKGHLIGKPVTGIRVTITDGNSHDVDSSEMAFRAAARGAFREGFSQAQPVILEPVMAIEVSAPEEFNSPVVAGLNRRKGIINDSRVEDGYVTVNCSVPLANMFGYSTDLRSNTQGKGEFSMEFANFNDMMRGDQEELVQAYQKERMAKNK